MRNHGFVAPVIEEHHYVLGGLSLLPEKEVQPDGNWLPLIPTFEPQMKRFVETANCTGFNTANAIEMLEYRITGILPNYSDRALGMFAGTRPPGNDPHTVAEAIRKYGLIPDEMLPFSDDIISTSDYYSFKGADEKECYAAGKKWLEKWDFGHEWVFHPGNKKDWQKKMMTALKYSPLGVSVVAWEKKGKFFVKNKGEEDNHWTTCVLSYKENEYWVIYDTYLDDGQPIKYLPWDYDFNFCKRYSLTLREQRPDSWTKIICDVIKGIWK